jgi:hypothetical protein
MAIDSPRSPGHIKEIGKRFAMLTEAIEKRIGGAAWSRLA